MEKKPIQYDSLKAVPASAWKKLAESKIYFGHQSIGYNIINGIEALIEENPNFKLNIVETSNPGDLKKGIFAHSRIGANTDPKSKIDDFVKKINRGIGEKADIALLKFCYIDATENTDVQKIFLDYKRAMARLANENPKTVFIHSTMPLTSRQTGPKAWIKELLGKAVRGVGDNIRRKEYNDLLIEEYAEKEIVFDIASIESGDSDERKMTFEKKGKTICSMVPEYTNDGGHLNETGGRMVAEKLLLLLLNSLESK